MQDLISRQAVIDLLKKSASRDIEEVVITDKHINLIKDMPCAYNIEKVVAELEEERGISYVDFDEYAYRYELDLCDNDDWFYRGLERAIKLVKRGGVE